MLQKEGDAHMRMESWDDIKQNVYRYRRELFPRAPSCRADICFPDDWKMTLDKRQEFLLIDDGIENRILVIRCTF